MVILLPDHLPIIQPNIKKHNAHTYYDGQIYIYLNFL